MKVLKQLMFYMIARTGDTLDPAPWETHMWSDYLEPVDGEPIYIITQTYHGRTSAAVSLLPCHSPESLRELEITKTRSSAARTPCTRVAHVCRVLALVFCGPTKVKPPYNHCTCMFCNVLITGTEDS
eukprot:jgi/Chrzof1/6983/Cz02g06150.t1